MHSKASQILKSIFCMLFFLAFIMSIVNVLKFNNANILPNENNTQAFVATVSDVYEGHIEENNEGTFVLYYEILTNEYDDIIYVDRIMIADLDAMQALSVGDEITFWVELSNIGSNDEIKDMSIVQLYANEKYIVTFESYGKVLEPVLLLSKNLSIAFSIIMFILFAVFAILVIKGRKNLKIDLEREMQRRIEKIDAIIKAGAGNKNLDNINGDRKLSSREMQSLDFQTSYNDNNIEDDLDLKIKYSLCKNEVTKGVDKFMLKKFKAVIALLSLVFVGGIVLTAIAMNTASMPLYTRVIGIVSANFSGFFLFVIFALRLRYINNYGANEEGKVTIEVTFGLTLKFINFNTKETIAWNYSSLYHAYEFVDYFTIYWNGMVLVISKESLSSSTILNIRKILSQKLPYFKSQIQE